MRSVRSYQYDSVYSSTGEELRSLEQVRAALPQYRTSPVGGLHNVVQATAVHYQKDKVYPPSGEELQLEQVRAMLQKYHYQHLCDMDMTEVSTSYITVCGDRNQENRILPRGDIKEELLQYSIDDQLELMCADKPVPNVQSVLPSSGIEDKFEQELRQLDLEDAPATSSLKNKENQPRCEGKYAFTPDTMEGALNWPCKGADLVHTKLNFTDTESTLSMSCGGHANTSRQRVFGSQVAKFNVASNLEDKAKLLHSHRGLEDEFAVTEISRDQARGINVASHLFSRDSFQDSKDESNFTAFHDSMQTSPSFRKLSARKPLQELPFQKSSSEDCALNPSLGVYEDTCDESSFIPYHDSMQTSISCKNPSVLQDQGPRAYSAPLGVPIVHYEPVLSEQTFTQIDIAHPKDFDCVSTPKTAYQQRDFSMNLSMIPPEIEDAKPMHVQASKPGTLTPIKEEPSGSSKLTSSSRFTVSSSNSSGNSCQSVSSDHHSMDCNPFIPDMINRMLNSLGGMPQDAVQIVTNQLPFITPGKTLLLPGSTYHSVSFLTTCNTRSSDIYLVQGCFGKQVLQVYSTDIPLMWEVTILNQLQHRLQIIGLQEFSDSFQQFSQVYQFPTSFVTLSMHYCFGSIQNVVKKFYTAKKVIPDSLVAYLSLEMLSVTGYLHQCGIIHAALKPAHFLVCDVSNCGKFRSGFGLRLIDFRRAIDTRQFPNDQMFVGTPPHLTSIVMAEGQPWKWQLDYCGLALCILSLLTSNGGLPVQMNQEKSGIYTCSKKLCKKYDTCEWQDLISKLLNAVGLLPLHQLGDFLQEKAQTCDVCLMKL